MNAKEIQQRREALQLATVALSATDLPALRLLSVGSRRQEVPVVREFDGSEGRAFVALHVFAGSCEARFNDGETDSSVTVSADQLYFMHDANLVSVQTTQVPFEFYWFEFITEQNHALPLNHVMNQPLLRNESRDFALIKSQLLKRSPWAGRRATARFAGLLTDWLANCEATDQLPPTEDLVEQAIQRMNRIDGSSPNMADLAAEAKQHMSTFNRNFKRSTGLTSKQYQTRVRNQLALELLLRGESVKDVADKLGYFDSFHFSHAFSSNYGFPPSHVHEVVDKTLVLARV